MFIHANNELDEEIKRLKKKQIHAGADITIKKHIKYLEKKGYVVKKKDGAI
jgi:ribosomal protein S21